MKPSRLRLISAILSVAGGLGTIGAMWLPLVRLAGLGVVGPFDYSRWRVYECITAAGLLVISSLLGVWRAVLLFTGVLCGLLVATGIDLYQALGEVVNATGGDRSQVARYMIARNWLQVGAYILPLCCLACIAGAFLGGPRGGGATATNKS